MISIKRINEWYYDLSEADRWDILETISPDELDEDFWEHLDDDLKRSIYREEIK